METRAQLEQRRDAPVVRNPARRRPVNVPINFSSVDFPDPFEPMSPYVEPAGTSRLTSSNALNISNLLGRRLVKRSFNDVRRSR